MAAAVNNGSIKRYPDLKTDFIETMFLSKNENLKEIIRGIVDGEVEKDDMLYGLIKAGNWKGLDAFILEHTGQAAFFMILQQFFLFKYFLPNKDDSITRKEFEIAMGIQQVRWMVDPNNCRIKKVFDKNETTIINYKHDNGRILTNYRVENADFCYWQDIPEDERTIISRQINEIIIRRLSNPPIDYNKIFVNTVWYKVLFTKNGKKTTAGSWSGYGSEEDYYPIPETLNISDIACIYQPKLVFGSLSDFSLLKFIINYGQRPYIAHVPDSTSNLCDVHGLEHAIVAGWRHDIHHSFNGDCTTDVLRYLNYYCKLDPKINFTTLKEEINKNAQESQLVKCLKGPDGETLARGINDTGRVLHDPPFPHLAGGKRKTRRSLYKKRGMRKRKRTMRK